MDYYLKQQLAADSLAVDIADLVQKMQYDSSKELKEKLDLLLLLRDKVHDGDEETINKINEDNGVENE